MVSFLMKHIVMLGRIITSEDCVDVCLQPLIIPVSNQHVLWTYGPLILSEMTAWQQQLFFFFFNLFFTFFSYYWQLTSAWIVLISFPIVLMLNIFWDLRSIVCALGRSNFSGVWSLFLMCNIYFVSLCHLMLRHRNSSNLSCKSTDNLPVNKDFFWLGSTLGLFVLKQ